MSAKKRNAANSSQMDQSLRNTVEQHEIVYKNESAFEVFGHARFLHVGIMLTNTMCLLNKRQQKYIIPSVGIECH